MTKDLGQAATKLQQLLGNSQDQLSKEKEKVRTLQDQLQDKVQTSYILIKVYRTNSCMPVLTLFVLCSPGGWWRAEARHICLKCKNKLPKIALRWPKWSIPKFFFPFLSYYSLEILFENVWRNLTHANILFRRCAGHIFTSHSIWKLLAMSENIPQLPYIYSVFLHLSSWCQC